MIICWVFEWNKNGGLFFYSIYIYILTSAMALGENFLHWWLELTKIMYARRHKLFYFPVLDDRNQQSRPSSKRWTRFAFYLCKSCFIIHPLCSRARENGFTSSLNVTNNLNQLVYHSQDWFLIKFKFNALLLFLNQTVLPLFSR